MEQYIGIGRRKSSVARVYLRPGRGRVVINGKSPEDYFSKHLFFEDIVRSPLKETHTASKYDLVVTARGGGINGQAEAIRHGVARALEKVNPAHRPALKAAGFLRRDSRRT